MKYISSQLQTLVQTLFLALVSFVAPSVAHGEENKEESAPFVQTAPEKTTLKPKHKQLVHAKVTQNKKDQALIALSNSLSKVAEPSKLVADQQKEKEKPKEKKRFPYVFVHGDFLYLKTKNEGLSYGQQVPSAQLTLNSIFDDLSGTTERVSPGYHSGFFVEVGAFLPHHTSQNSFENRGRLALSWTRLHNQENAHTDQALGKLIIPSTANTNGEPLAQSASASWQMHLNLLDLSYGKMFKPLRSLCLKPSIALRGAWVGQEFNVTYANIAYAWGGRGAFIDTHLSNHFKAVGLRAGLDTSWRVVEGFSLFAKGAISLLVSKIDLHQSENRGLGEINQIIENFHPLTPVFELSAGAGWKTAFKNGRYILAFEAGWQELLFLNETRWQRPYGNLEKADLGLAGYFLGARVAF